MNPKSTWLWLGVAAGLFAVIFLLDRYLPKPETGPRKVLPHLSAAAVNSLQIQPTGQSALRVERTNGGWQLTDPLVYPVPATNVESLLQALEQLTAADYIPPAELKQHPNASQEYGFDPPQATVVLNQSDSRSSLWIGRTNVPGNQVFAQVIGAEGVFVLDAALLKLMPHTDKDWRETALADWRHLEFDHFTATNGGKILELQRNPTNKLWRIVHQPMDTRADNEKVGRSLASVRNLRVKQFVSDDPKADLESFGLLNPDLSLAFFQGTNQVLLLLFGKSPTNDLIYAKRADRNSIVTVASDLLEPWRTSQGFREFFDRHLVSLTVPVDRIQVRAQDDFAMQRQTNDTWRILPPQDLPADAGLVGDVIAVFTNLEVDIVRDVVTEQDWPTYGLATPARQYLLSAMQPDAGDGSTNTPVAQVYFGIVETNVFARVAGENFVYSVNTNVLLHLPWLSFQMRDRRIWNFSEDQVAQLTIHMNGKIWELIRNATNSWSFGTNSQGILPNKFGLNETTVLLGQLYAASWLERGDTNRVQYGIATNAYALTVELKDGRKLSVEIGDPQPTGIPNAVVLVEGEPWIFVFPLGPYQYVKQYLSIPDYVPPR